MLRWQYPWRHLQYFAQDAGKGGGGSGDDGGDGGGTGGGADTGGTGDAGGDTGGTPAPTYATWYATLEPGPKALIEGNIAGLRSALVSEKDGRKALTKQLRDATVKLDEGSDARKALEDATSKLELAERRAQFNEDVSKPEIGCSDLRLAYLAAVEDELFDSRGNVDLDELKKKHPVLFGVKPKWPKGDAGTGGGQTGGQKPGMNAFIRTAAGRRAS